MPYLTLFSPLLALGSLCLAIGAILGYASRRFKVEEAPLVDRINELLPQTQCGQCSHPGCLPYARAIAEGEAINRCPPGGQKTINDLAKLLNVKPLPLDQSYGMEEPRKVALIREEECIGCLKCIPACPVDAIIGASKFMHTVIESECTGCDLCVEPCPVDCIDMVEVKEPRRPRLSTGNISTAEIQACIRCGLCVPACPVDILPQQLYWVCKSEELDKAINLNLMECIECLACTNACPSGIELRDYYVHAKNEIHNKQEEKARADQAKKRFEYHELRMKMLAAEEEDRRKKRAELSKESSSNTIQDALARAKAKAMAKKNASQ